jgi:RPA family protein
MKKITTAEYELMKIRIGRNASLIYTQVFNLAINESGVIEKKEWSRKASPSRMIRRMEKIHKRKYIVGTLADDSGWAVKRIA